MTSKPQMPDCAGTSFTNVLSISNYTPFRQGKSLDFESATFLIKLRKKHGKIETVVALQSK